VDVVSFVVVSADSAAAREAMTSYFAEIDERFDGGFDSAAAFDDDAGTFDPPAGCFVAGFVGERVVGCGGVQHHNDHSRQSLRASLVSQGSLNR